MHAVSFNAEWKGYSSPWVFHHKFTMPDVKSQSLVFVVLIFSFALVQYFMLYSTTPFWNGNIYSVFLYKGNIQIDFEVMGVCS